MALMMVLESQSLRLLTQNNKGELVSSLLYINLKII
jgi:hypothetical protein